MQISAAVVQEVGAPFALTEQRSTFKSRLPMKWW
jgi:hypothetical protein